MRTAAAVWREKEVWHGECRRQRRGYPLGMPSFWQKVVRDDGIKVSIIFGAISIDFMCGAYDLEHDRIRESKYVANEYGDGKFCEEAYEEAYEEVYNANRRICERLGVDEDKDVELIVRNLTDIGKHLSMKMNSGH